MYRFFVAPENIHGSLVHIDAEQTRHIDKVLRFKSGDTILVFDGLGHEYEICLVGKENGSLIGEIVQEIERKTESSLYLSLVQGLAKGDKMDAIIQKAVEIGIGDIYPLECQYTVVKLDKERAGKKVERWQSIAREACKQCRRNRVPIVHPPCSFTELMKTVADYPTILLYENEEDMRLKTLLRENQEVFLSASRLFLIIGPEGGLSPEEVSLAQSRGIMTAGLGPRILRTETAGLVAAAIILYELADLG